MKKKTRQDRGCEKGERVGMYHPLGAAVRRPDGKKERAKARNWARRKKTFEKKSRGGELFAVLDVGRLESWAQGSPGGGSEPLGIGRGVVEKREKDNQVARIEPRGKKHHVRGWTRIAR